MSPEESFAGVNPERLAMLQARENPVPRDFSGRGRDRDRDRGRGRGRRGGGGGGGRGGYQSNGRRFAFNRGVGSPAAANGGTKESTPAEEQLSGAEMRLAFKRNQERRSGTVVENCANGVDVKERKRKWGDGDTAAVEPSLGSSKKRKNDGTNGVAAITNGAPTMDKKRKHEMEKMAKRDKKAERAKKHAVEVEEEPTPTNGTLSSSKPLDDDQNLSKEAKKAAKRAKKEKKEKRKAAKTRELVNGSIESSQDISKSKKPKKDKKSKTGKSKEPSYSPTDPPPAKKSKKSKTEVSAGVGGERAELKWTAAAADLPGDDQRKSKFLRLLGAGAGAGALPTTNGSASSSSTKTREKELERQYDAGLKMKAEKKRRGLGA